MWTEADGIIANMATDLHRMDETNRRLQLELEGALYEARHFEASFKNATRLADMRWRVILNYDEELFAAQEEINRLNLQIQQMGDS